MSGPEGKSSISTELKPVKNKIKRQSIKWAKLEGKT